MSLSYRDAATLLALIEKHTGSKEHAEKFIREAISMKLGQKSTRETWVRMLSLIERSKPEDGKEKAS